MTPADLLTAIRRDRTVLDALVAALTESQLTSVGDDEGWSIKDHLAHIASWERMIVAHLRDGSDHIVAGMDKVSYTGATLDQLNEQLYRLSRDRAPTDVLREYADAHKGIVEFIAGLTPDRLATAYWDDDPSKRTVLDKITGDTYLHYLEHAAWIREIIGQPAVQR